MPMPGPEHQESGRRLLDSTAPTRSSTTQRPADAKPTGRCNFSSHDSAL
ncbi:hypothetical protein ACP70R_004331 [Stipagrostis hirtigluma subsp. patula]